jgi:hypothetical protein
MGTTIMADIFQELYLALTKGAEAVLTTELSGQGI